MKRVIGAAFILAFIGAPALADGPAPIVRTLLDAAATADQKPIRYPNADGKVTTLVVELAPGGTTGRHRHPMPVMGYIIDGEVTVAADGAEPHRYVAGDAFMETTTWHEGRNTGNTPVKILAVYMGTSGEPLVIKPEGGDGHY